MKKQKQLVRLADHIRSAILKMRGAKLEDVQAKLEIIESQNTEFTKDAHRLRVAVKRGFSYASAKVIRKISRDLNDFNYHICRFKDIITPDKCRMPALSEIVSELMAAEQEFDQFSFDLKAKTISVTTKSIDLEGITLGRFEIRLLIDEFDKLYKERPYRIIALEPNPAGGDCNVSHPHVSHERLCEGDGHTAITRALEQARLSDFFSMVIAVLENYNPDSPYIPLSEWDGTSCYDCGGNITSEECYYCENCEHDFCENCSSYCQICGTTLCLGCVSECQGCKEYICGDCMVTCNECGSKFCKDCLTDGLCVSCQQESEDNEDEECEQQPQDSKVHAGGMGETAVYAGHDGQ